MSKWSLDLQKHLVVNMMRVVWLLTQSDLNVAGRLVPMLTEKISAL